MWIEHEQTMWFQVLCLEILLVCLVSVGTGTAGSVWMQDSVRQTLYHHSHCLTKSASTEVTNLLSGTKLCHYQQS